MNHFKKVLLASLIYCISASSMIGNTLSDDESSSHTALRNTGLEHHNPVIPVLKNAGLMYVGMWWYLFFHEFGHALCSKMLNGNDIDIHLGKRWHESKPLLFGTQSIKFHSLNPLNGGHANMGRTNSIAKQFTMHIAGSVTGALALYAFLGGYQAYNLKQRNPHLSVSQALKQGFSSLSRPFENLLARKVKNPWEFYGSLVLLVGYLGLHYNRLLCGLFPSRDYNTKFPQFRYDNQTDGTRAWLALGAGDTPLNCVSFVVQIIDWILRFYTLKGAYNTAKSWHHMKDKNFDLDELLSKIKSGDFIPA